MDFYSAEGELFEGLYGFFVIIGCCKRLRVMLRNSIDGNLEICWPCLCVMGKVKGVDSSISLGMTSLEVCAMAK